MEAFNAANMHGGDIDAGMAHHQGQAHNMDGLDMEVEAIAVEELLNRAINDAMVDENDWGNPLPHHLRDELAQEPHQQTQTDDEEGSVMTEDDVLVFTDDEHEELDTTAEQVSKYGRDLQGIPWDQLHFTRADYRTTRLKQYRNYVNVLPENPDEYRPDLLKRCKHTVCGHNFFNFTVNHRSVNTTIVHFQLRNLVWATSRNDVLVVSKNNVNHWNPITRKSTEVLNMSGGGDKHVRPPSVGKVQVSTMCVSDDLIAAGGFGGELVVKRLGDPGWVYAGRISSSENGITNGLEIFNSPSHGCCVMASNNDSLVRLFAADTFKCIAQWEFAWAVNYASMQPSGQVAAIVGDDPVTCLMDIRTGLTVNRLEAHADFSFAAAWHPDGNLLATGNQDTTTVVWDVRKPDEPLVRLAGRIGAIRSLRWSRDGRFLAASEPADFVHVYDVTSGFTNAQEIDLFGEISGISFTPAGDTLFVGIADVTYASLLSFTRARPGAAYLPAPGRALFAHSSTAHASPRSQEPLFSRRPHVW